MSASAPTSLSPSLTSLPSTLLRRFLLATATPRIVSDGDLDGVFATALLVRLLRRWGYAPSYSFPDLHRIAGTVLENVIVVEIPSTRGVSYRGTVLLIDHHLGPPRYVLLRNGAEVERVEFHREWSVAGLVYRSLYRELGSPAELEPFVDAVDAIDEGRHPTVLAERLHCAFAARIDDPSARANLVEIVANLWLDRLWRWIANGYRRWLHVAELVDQLVSRTLPLPSYPSAGYFVYTPQERPAATAALLRVEDLYTIGIAILVGDNRVSAARLATKQNIDLTPVFQRLHKPPLRTAGGRANVGGVQFLTPLPLEEALRVLSEAFSQAMPYRGA